MQAAEFPAREAQRLKTLYQYQILDTEQEQYFDDLTHLAAYICQTPIAAIGLMDSRREWFKSKVGFLAPEEPRDFTFCEHAILKADLLVIPDTLCDRRFINNPFVKGAAQIRFYAGAPLINSEGYALGTLSVLDHVPRQLDLEQQTALRILARQVVTQLELRRNLKALEQTILERQRTETQLRHNAYHDELTGLPNRALFMRHLRIRIQQTQQQPEAQLAVLFVDVDRFKLVNDSLGHLIGDQLLVNIAHRLQSCLRPQDTVARLGGDEFAILLTHITHPGDALEVADRIQATLKQPFNLRGQEVFSSSSIGIALSSTDYQRPEELLRDADIALYRAKAQGKGRHQIFDMAMHDSSVALLQLETELHRAIEHLIRFQPEASEFEIYYQPIIELRGGKIVGFEALVRWQHPTRGLLSPGEFVPILEETGGIIPLSDWVLRQSCRQLRRWQSQFANPFLTISVNISSRLFSQTDLVEKISKILEETDLEGHSLHLEITESAIMENAGTAVATILQLRQRGMQLHLDDFGTGYSSFNYLQQFPVDVLKIDRSFIHNMEICDQADSQDCAPIVRTILTLAHHLTIEVTAEGVETLEQARQLKSWNCQYAQGYFFSPPVDGVGAENLLAQDPFWGLEGDSDSWLSEESVESESGSDSGG